MRVMTGQRDLIHTRIELLEGIVADAREHALIDKVTVQGSVDVQVHVDVKI